VPGGLISCKIISCFLSVDCGLSMKIVVCRSKDCYHDIHRGMMIATPLDRMPPLRIGNEKMRERSLLACRASKEALRRESIMYQ